MNFYYNNLDSLKTFPIYTWIKYNDYISNINENFIRNILNHFLNNTEIFGISQIQFLYSLDIIYINFIFFSPYNKSQFISNISNSPIFNSSSSINTILNTNIFQILPNNSNYTNSYFDLLFHFYKYDYNTFISYLYNPFSLTKLETIFSILFNKHVQIRIYSSYSSLHNTYFFSKKVDLLNNIHYDISNYNSYNSSIHSFTSNLINSPFLTYNSHKSLNNFYIFNNSNWSPSLPRGTKSSKFKYNYLNQLFYYQNIDKFLSNSIKNLNFISSDSYSYIILHYIFINFSKFINLHHIKGIKIIRRGNINSIRTRQIKLFNGFSNIKFYNDLTTHSHFLFFNLNSTLIRTQERSFQNFIIIFYS
jgi:hypothetical protein